MGVHIEEMLILCYEGQVQIVPKNRKFNGRSTAQNGQHEKQSEATQDIGIYLALYSSRKCEKLQPFCNVVMKTAGVLCMC